MGWALCWRFRACPNGSRLTCGASLCRPFLLKLLESTTCNALWSEERSVMPGSTWSGCSLCAHFVVLNLKVLCSGWLYLQLNDLTSLANAIDEMHTHKTCWLRKCGWVRAINPKILHLWGRGEGWPCHKGRLISWDSLLYPLQLARISLVLSSS